MRAGIFTDAHRDRTVVYQNRPWENVLKDLYERGVRRLLVEGGARTTAGLIAARKVHEVILFFSQRSAERGYPRVADWGGWDWGRAAVTGAGRDLCLRGILKGAN